MPLPNDDRLGQILCALVASMQANPNNDGLLETLTLQLLHQSQGSTALLEDAIDDLKAIRDFLLSNSDAEGEKQTIEQLRAKLKVIPPSCVR